jgi:hypothetical protein
MTDQEVFEKNLILSTEFDRYILEHPEVADKIPLNAQVVLLPEDDKELCRINMQISEKQREKRQQVVYVHIGTIAPPVSRLMDVNLEVKTEMR